MQTLTPWIWGETCVCISNKLLGGLKLQGQQTIVAMVPDVQDLLNQMQEEKG